MKRSLVALACAILAGSAPQTTAAAALVPPPRLERLIVAVDRIGDPPFETTLARGATIELAHFARHIDWAYVDALRAADVNGADGVIYFGLHGAPPASGFSALYGAKRLIVFTQHLAQLHAVGLFPHVVSARQVFATPATRVDYAGLRFAVNSTEYTLIRIAPGTRVLGTIDGAHKSPFAIVDGSDTFVTAPLSFASDLRDPYKQGLLLAACDVIRIALGGARRPKIALLRLEDVSVRVPASRLRAVVEYLALRRVPYGIGVIPDQLIKGQTVRSLRDDPELVAVLRYAQDHGARIILHGLHHSFNSPEDFEFWDAVHNRPLPEDSERWMRRKIETGISLEESLGLRPVMWESPHYAASPLDYRVIARYFPLAWERRRPVGFTPWALERDEYGSALLPENLGYISNGRDPAMTAALQLARARAFTACGDCIPAGFLHPATVALEDVARFVDGVEALGYRFADPLTIVKPRSP